ncbi:hypothetical protein [Actinokineospora inagensis]|uniref:hypothetical protein n=1 Tax=Actinokineospora inagensis TaxID=103730 RepID=UPI000401D604|nr:hypothetical protein [Actinokineospora inagensis]
MGFSHIAWERAAAAVAARAVREVPFYRERHARGLGVAPVPAAELERRLWALCPLSRPYSAQREPTLWTGDPADLAAVLRISGLGWPVVEVRSALVPWTRLGLLGPRYAPVLSGSAIAVDVSTTDGPAKALAASGVSVLVSPPDDVADVVARIGHRGPVVRSLVKADQPDGHAVLHDRHLGYFAEWSTDCAQWHVPWRRFHVDAGEGGILVTALRRRRPTLVRVLVDVGLGRVAECPAHGTPVLLA